MGLGEMLGIKSIKIEPKEAMTLEELYNKIKDVEYSFGKPEYIKHGMIYVIAFPPEDRENQVWIMATKTGFVVQRSVSMAGMSNMFESMAIAEAKSQLTMGVSGMKSAFGAPKKACFAHCDEVADKVKKVLGL